MILRNARPYNWEVDGHQEAEIWEFAGFAYLNGAMDGELQTADFAERMAEVEVVLL